MQQAIFLSYRKVAAGPDSEEPKVFLESKDSEAFAGEVSDANDSQRVED